MIIPRQPKKRIAPPNQSSVQYPPESEARPSRPAHLRQGNARGLLRLLREHNPCSKADLVRLSRLTAPTVSSSISYLESLGLIESLGDGLSNGGRPPELLRFHAQHGYLAGVDIGGTRLRMVLADLNGKIIAQWSVQYTEKQRTPKVVCALIHDGLKVMCQEAGASLKRVLHITAGVPGITNVDTGVVVSAPNLKDWDQVPLRAMLERTLGIPALVENDTNLAAVGEHWRGSAQGISNFIFVALGTGVGAGIFLRGTLHHGAAWSAGEIGYMSVNQVLREPLDVRSTGQLEDAIGGQGIELKWVQLLERHKRGQNQDLSQLRASEIFDLAAEGDRLAIEVVQYTAQILASCLLDLGLALDPEMIVLGGGVGCHAELCKATNRMIQLNQFAKPQIWPSALGSQAQLHGAICLSLTASEVTLLGGLS